MNPEVGKKPCVLLVSAALELHAAFEYVLNEGGFDTVTVTSRRDGMRELNARGGRTYAVVVVDDELLNGNGLDLLAELKVRPDSKPPSVFMVRNLTREVEMQASSMGATRIIGREYFGELAGLVRDIMDEKQTMVV